MKQLLYIDLFCGAGGTSTGVERAVVDGKDIKADTWYKLENGQLVECD